MRLLVLALTISFFSVSAFAGCNVFVKDGFSIIKDKTDLSLSKKLTKTLMKNGYSISSDAKSADFTAGIFIDSGREQRRWRCDMKIAVIQIVSQDSEVKEFHGSSTFGNRIRCSIGEAVNEALSKIPECHKL